MELSNRTPFQATLIHGPDGPEHHGVAVLFKTQQPLLNGCDRGFLWPILQKEMETDFGNFPMDHHLPLAKLDLVVCGQAHTPNARVQKATRVGLRVGGFSYEHQVWGDRIWKKRLFNYEAGDPQAFTVMPLTLSGSYGGTLKMPYGDVPHPANPLGKGFLLPEMAPEGQPLPNLDREGQCMTNPFDMPDPVCMAPYPAGWKLRVDRLSGPAGPRPFVPADSNLYFGIAHPDLVIGRPEVGATVEVWGVHPTQNLVSEIPDVPARVLLVVDGHEHELAVTLDAITVFAHVGWVGYRYRAAGRFVLEPRQSRSVHLEEVA